MTPWAASASEDAAPRESIDAEASILARLRDVSVVYWSTEGIRRWKAPVTAIDGVSLDVFAGESLGVVGQTGAGKSTIARLVMGMVAPSKGSVEIGGVDISNVRGNTKAQIERLRQIVLQDPFSSLNPRMRVGDIIAEPLLVGRPKPSAHDRSRRVAEMLRLVGLAEEHAKAFPHQFSGGQRQRISIARALAPNPRLVVLDEPTSALDMSIRAQILTLLRSLQQRLGHTYLVISHDLTTVAYLTMRVAVMYRGRIVELGPTREVFRNPQHPYTLRLLESAPRADVDFVAMATQPELKPLHSAVASPGACRYASECLLRARVPGSLASLCAVEPVLVPLASDHASACHHSARVHLARAAVEFSAEEPDSSRLEKGS